MLEFDAADSCYEITKPSYFFKALTDTLNSIVPVVFRGIHDVIYQDRREEWNRKDWGHHPALIKEPKFSNQAEIRAIWQPRNVQPIQPIITANYKLIEACRELPI